MANIFAGMGSGSQSGKLTFKRLLPGTNINISQNASCIILESTAPLSITPITNCRVVWGCGTGITASNSSFRISSTNNSLFSFGSIRSNHSYSYSSYVSNLSSTYNALSVGGCCNGIYSISAAPSDSVIAGGAGNTIDSGYRSTIVGGNLNEIDGINYFSSIIGGRSNKIKGPGSYYSSRNLITGGCSNVICNFGDVTSSRYNFISGLNNQILNFSGTSLYNSISGGSCNLLCFCHINCNNSVMSSCCSCIKSNTVSSCLKFNSILGGSCNNILGQYITGCHNSILGGCNNQIYSAESSPKFNSIVSSNGSKICNYIASSTIYNQIISGVNGCILGGSKYSSIISSANSSICAGSSGNSGKHNSIIGGESNIINSYGLETPQKYTSIIGGYYNCACSSYTTILGGSNNCSITNYIYELLGGNKYCTFLSSFISGGFSNTTCFNGTMSGSHIYIGAFAAIIGGRCNTSSSISISGYYNRNFGHSINIGGSCNSSSLSTQNGLNPGFSIFSCPNGDLWHEQSSVILGGRCLCSNGNISSVLVAGCGNKIINNNSSAIIGGRDNVILSRGTYRCSGGSFTNFPTGRNHFILGGCFNRICSCITTDRFTQKATNTGIIGGCNNSMFERSDGDYTTIIGGMGMSSSSDWRMVTQCLLVVGTISTDYNANGVFGNPGSTICCGWTGDCLNPTSIRIVNGLVVNVI